MKTHVLLAYIFLVGLPALGLVMILDAGHNLKAPPAVSGTWRVEGDWTPLPRNGHMTAFSGATPVTLTISQSGTELFARWGGGSGTTLAGTVAPGRMVIGKKAPGDTVYATASVNGDPENRTLTGELYANWCPPCGPVSFRAARNRAGGRFH